MHDNFNSNINKLDLLWEKKWKQSTLRKGCTPNFKLDFFLVRKINMAKIGLGCINLI